MMTGFRKGWLQGVTLAGCMVLAGSASALMCWKGTCDVEWGDTLAKIAKQEGVSVTEAQAALGLSDPMQLRVGQQYSQAEFHSAVRHLQATENRAAYIAENAAENTAEGMVASLRPGTPYQETYAVAAGDTLFSVMRKTGVSWIDIAKLNSLSAPYALSVGQVLAISPIKYK